MVTTRPVSSLTASQEKHWAARSRRRPAVARASSLKGPRAAGGPAASVVEEPEVRERHGHAVGVTGGDDLPVRHGAARLGHVLHAQLGRMVDGVAEGEEGVRGDGDARELAEEFGLFLRCEGFGGRLEVLLPLCPLGRLHVTLDVTHARVHAVLALHVLGELQARNLLVEAEPPRGHLPASELHAVHAALLPRSHPHHHAALGVAHGVGLRVLNGDGGEDEVQLGRQGQLLLLRHELLQARGREELIVAPLHEAHAAHHAVLL
mmetsp:Transcript_15041/g.47404  ORF Transcript_15041/g.47404 Transcript_15041/m.47404 type:complete len:263 (+) Transcript_15041:19-807(+)